MQEMFTELFDCDFDDMPSEPLGRIKLDKDWLWSDTGAEDWIDDPHELLLWLEKHPQATAHIGRWNCVITSPDIDDVLTLRRFEPPFGLKSAVEDHGHNRHGGVFEVFWVLC